MSFNGWVDLFFHFLVLRALFLEFEVGRRFLLKTAAKCQDYLKMLRKFLNRPTSKRKSGIKQSKTGRRIRQKFAQATIVLPSFLPTTCPFPDPSTVTARS